MISVKCDKLQNSKKKTTKHPPPPPKKIQWDQFLLIWWYRQNNLYVVWRTLTLVFKIEFPSKPLPEEPK